MGLSPEQQAKQDALQAGLGIRKDPGFSQVGPGGTPYNQRAADEYLKALAQARKDYRSKTPAGQIDRANLATQNYLQALEAQKNLEHRRQQLLDLGKQRTAALWSGSGLAGGNPAFRKPGNDGLVQLAPSPYTNDTRKNYVDRQRELGAIQWASDNVGQSLGTNEQKGTFAAQFVSKLTGAAPEDTFVDAPNWQGYFQPDAQVGFFGTDPGETGFVNREFYVPITFGGHGSEDLNPHQYTALEGVYKMLYGEQAIPAYNAEGFTGDAATLAKAALKTYRTDQVKANTMMDEARILQAFGGYEGVADAGNPFWNVDTLKANAKAAAKTYQDQFNADAEVFGRTMAEARLKAAEEQKKKADSGPLALIGKVLEAWQGAASNANVGTSGRAPGGGIPNPHADPSLLGIAKEQLFDIPYYAWQRARDLGYGEAGSASVGIWSLPGLRALQNFTAPEGAGAITNSVNNPEKRAFLRETQGLTSFGENLIYDYTKVTRGKGDYYATFNDVPELGTFITLPAWLLSKALGTDNMVGGALHDFLDHRASGLADFAAQIAFDPLTYSPLITGKLGSPAELAANLAVRSEASSLARAGTAKLAAKGSEELFIDLSTLSVRTAAIGAAEDARGGILRAAEAWLRPASYLTETRIGEVGTAAREAWMSGRVGRAWLGQAEQAISQHATDLKALEKAFPDLVSSQAQELVLAAQQDGVSAALERLQGFIARGEYTPQVNVRRQLLSWMDNEGAFNSSVAGHNAPIFLGRSSIKKSGSSWANLMETLAGRGGVGRIFGGINGSTTTEKVVSVAGRVASLNDKIPMEVWKESIEKDVVKLRIPERLSRIDDIVPEGQADGLVQLLASMDVELTALAKVDPAAAETAMRSLEVVALKLTSGDEKERFAAELLLKRVVGEAGDPLGRSLDSAAVLLDQVKPRIKKLEEAADVIEPKYRGAFLGTAKEHEATLAQLERETRRLVEVKGGRKATLTAALEEKATRIEQLAGELDASLALQERRAILHGAWKQQDKQLESEMRAAVQAFKSERDELRKYRSGLSEYESKHRRINASKPWQERAAANADLTDWVKEQRRAVNEALDTSLAEQRKLEKTVAEKRADILAAFDKQVNDPRVVSAEKDIQFSIEELRSGVKSNKSIRAAARQEEDYWRAQVDDAGTDRIKRYITVRSMDRADFSDPLIARTIDSYNAMFTAEPFSLSDWMTEYRTLNAPADEAVREVSRGKKLLGPIPNDAAGRGAIQARMKALPDGLRVYFSEQLSEQVARGATDLTALGKQIERLATNPEFAHVVADQLTSESRLAEFLAENAAKGTRKYFKAARKPAQLALAFSESVAPRAIRFTSHDNEGISLINRLEDTDRWLADYEWDAVTRSEVRRIASGARSQDDMYALIKDSLVNYAREWGVPDDLFLGRQAQLMSEAKVATMATVDENGAVDIAKHVITPSQRGNLLPVLPAEEARAMARSWLADNADSRAVKAFAKARNKGINFLDNVDKETGQKGALSIRGTAKKGHSIWKLAVVTNAPVGMLVGGTAGFIYGDPYKDNDTWTDRLKWGGIGAAIGSLGGIRYIARVAGIEERLRMAVSRGFAPRDWVPGLGKMEDYGIEAPFRHPEDIVGTSSFSSHVTSGRFFAGNRDEWVAITQNDKLFLDAWARVVNRQLNPELNMIDRIVLQNFDKPNEEWRVLAKEWLTKTDDGGVELQKILGGLNLDNTPRNVEGILDNYAEFVQAYLPTEDLRLMRLSSPDGIPREILKEALGNDVAPPVVHSQRAWRFPKNLKDANHQYQQIYSKAVLELPTTKLNRVTMAKGIYADEFKAMRRAGVAVDVAQGIAEERAYRLTNKVMFQLSDESRFASKADFFFPFQQPREELLRVYGSLVATNPARTIRLGRLAAVAFNNGVSDGIFYEDGTGEWRMRVPGSAWLSRVLAPPGTEGVASGFDFRVRDLFFLLQGNAFAASDGTASPSGLLMGTLPAPGGPYWQAATAIAMHINPDAFETLQKNHPFIYERLYPYGTGGSLLRQETNRLWTAFAKTPPPWEFLTSDQQNASLHRLGIMVEQQMLAANKDNPDYVDYLISDEGQREVANQVSGLLLAWAAVGSVTPAATRPYFPGQAEFDSMAKTLKEQYGENGWVAAMYKLRPDMAEIYLTAKTEFTGDTTKYDDWLASISYDQNDMTYGRRTYLTAEAFAGQFKEARLRADAMRELGNAWDGIYIHSSDRYAEVEAVKSKWKDKGINLDDSYLAEKDLARILYSMPKDQQDNAINEWRLKFDIDGGEYRRMLKGIKNFKVDIRREARDIEDIRAAVEAAQRQNDGRSLESIVAALPNVAEQEKYWQYAISGIAYADQVSPGLRETYGDGLADSQQAKNNLAPLTDFYAIKGYLSKLHADSPGLLVDKSKVPKLTDEMEKLLTGTNADLIGGLNDKISQLYDAGAAAAKAKDWTTYYALKAQREDLRLQKLAALEAVYKKYPDMNEFQQDLAALTVFANNPDSAAYKKNLERLQNKLAIYGVPVIAFTSEERYYRDMPANVRAAFRANLIDRLNAEKGDFVLGGVDQKLYWARLTPFQRDILERGPLPDTALEKWKSEDPNAKSGGSKRGYGGGYSTNANTELAYAYGLMKQYSQRPKGAKAPAAYAEYRLIPASEPGQRSAFLKEHPEVQDWIRSGPMANMPVIDQMIVANIMVKYGKWEGEEMSADELTNLAWARQQMQTWSKRAGKEKPDTYDTWVNMPTGVEKAQYLEQHPEIGDWVKQGPMANMPDMYREVVRDIMVKYGQWSTEGDPLGELLSQYYTLPPQEKQKFLDAHPEIPAYWKAIRTPEEQAMADLTERYFALPDAGARSVFLSAHPELQKHFVDSRSRRYERFLNQVAVYMGSNPAVFEEYLNKQTQVLTELIGRFGTPSLIREKFNAPTASGPTQGTKGRVRRPSAA